jgi:integrase
MWLVGRTCQWTSEEARRFLECAPQPVTGSTPPTSRSSCSGLRKGELLGLGWDDLDLETGTVTIDWQIQRVGKVRGIERRRTKTASSDATLPLPPICVVALNEHCEAQKGDERGGG